MKIHKLYYKIALGLFSVTIAASILNSIINFEAVSLQFIKLGYPTYLIYTLCLSQALGLIILITRKGKWLVEWAYAGFFMNLIFGIIAHLLAKDGNGAPAVVCLILLIVTYIHHKKIRHIKAAKRKNSIEYTNLKKVV
ncbi:DoxX family protein [Cellulophaga sp. HaHaR_3_176]|uniref:DoxX family protein n=1 Tax=Cellulophaga sp. HaHaR_3_176 TaxID=1942464 RepID=UPI001C1F33F9|nr:DoxX family protein [Cellulophaga sp. HaHaR_3_176]QWX84961.1 DoxX family protein [Cellulophaga sp. HaHaR_3_176]